MSKYDFARQIYEITGAEKADIVEQADLNSFSSQDHTQKVVMETQISVNWVLDLAILNLQIKIDVL